jgi:hypothetical protein
VLPSTLPAPPGNGLAQHPMLYAGEGYNTLFLVNNGKVIWTYSSGRGGEIDDVWLMTNGHILYSRMSFIEEVTPQKKVVWHYDAPQGDARFTPASRSASTKFSSSQNGLPPKAIIINKATGAVEMEHALPAPSETDPKTVHAQFRRFRMTAAGTYLAPHLNMGKVVEYDKDFKPIWTYEVRGPWSAARLKNGNTLINSESGRVVREVNPEGRNVWEFNLRTDPPPARNPTCPRHAHGQQPDRRAPRQRQHDHLRLHRRRTQRRRAHQAHAGDRSHTGQENRLGPARLEKPRPGDNRPAPRRARHPRKTRRFAAVNAKAQTRKQRLGSVGHRLGLHEPEPVNYGPAGDKQEGSSSSARRWTAA